MAEKIQISSKDPSLGILTYRGLECELDKGMPENWIRFFIGRGEEEYPDYNHIHYLRNINVKPFITEDASSPFMPVWHAAVVLLDDDVPTRLLLVSEASVLDNLVQKFPPMPLIHFDYPAADSSRIKVELDDEEEKPENPAHNQFSQQHVDIFRGWPAKEYQQQYLRVSKQVRELAESMDTTAAIAIDYRMTSRQFEIDLHFEYCMAGEKQLILVQNDILMPEEAW